MLNPDSNGIQATPPIQKEPKSKHRSPLYPFVPLETAVTRIQDLYQKEGRHAVRFNVVASHWGNAPKSSAVRQTIGALKQFGLLSIDEGKGDESKVRLTDLAFRILLEERLQEKLKALKESALAPKLYGDLWQKWGSELPSNESIRSYLIFDLKFNPKSVNSVIFDYKATLSYAFLLGDGKIQEPVNDLLNGKEAEDSPSEHLDGGEPQGIVQTTSSVRPVVSRNANPSEEEYLRVRLVKGRTVRVLFSGPPPTRSEIDKLIALLELNKDQYPDEVEV